MQTTNQGHNTCFFGHSIRRSGKVIKCSGIFELEAQVHLTFHQVSVEECVNQHLKEWPLENRPWDVLKDYIIA